MIGIGLVIWLVVVLLMIGLGFYLIIKSIKMGINTEYKYSMNLHKEGFKRSNFPIIKIRIRNKYKYFLVDSGANVNLIAKEAYKDIVGKGTVTMVDEGTISGLGSTEDEAISIVSEAISINGDKFTEHFRISSSWNFSRQKMNDVTGLDIVGILGTEFFNKAKWVLDFDQLVVWVKK